MAGIVTAEHLQQFRTQGYFILENFFPVEEIDQLREQIDTFAETHGVMSLTPLLLKSAKRNDIVPHFEHSIKADQAKADQAYKI